MNKYKEIEEIFSNFNSITKFPSIPTFHKIGDRSNSGILDLTQNNLEKDCDELVLTEKVDGTNVRIINNGGFFYIGSRNDLLYFSQDLLWSSTMDIVKSLLQEELFDFELKNLEKTDKIVVLYGELYGNKINGKSGKIYTSKDKVGFRAFDVMVLSKEQYEYLDELEPEKIAGWRESQERIKLSKSEDELKVFASKFGVGTVPYLGSVKPQELLEKTAEQMLEWIKSHVGKTLVGLDNSGQGEGLVLTNPKTGYKLKARIEDYERTIRKMANYA